MRIKEIILDGFKSYPNRTVVSGFDASFNAITGLNGSGKSNILDAICFVLGISNLSQVRVSSLQELVYKNGQGGVNKATVTLVFDNSDRDASPVGFEDQTEFTVTRQVVVGGRNKYLINGVNAQLSRVQNLFHSVQLNVNNPHFLIMQGRITKVINMRAPEVLAMVEEAAGTRMFELKKSQALRTIDKKDVKVDEIRRVLAEEITPTLERLRRDKAGYMQWSANSVEIERLGRLCTAAEYSSAVKSVERAGERRSEMERSLEKLSADAEKFAEELEAAEADLSDLASLKGGEMEAQLRELEARASELSKDLVQKAAERDNALEALREEEKALDAARTAVRDARDAARAKAEEVAGIEASGADAAAERARAEAELTRMRREHEAICTGVSADGNNGGSLADQLMVSKRERSEAETEHRRVAMRRDQAAKEHAKLAKEVKAAEAGIAKINAQRAELAGAVEAARAKLEAARADGGDGGDEDTLRAEVERAEVERRSRAETAERLSAKLAALDFEFSDPVRGFDRSRVRGLVANLIKVADPKHEAAIEVTAGGRLFNVVVDTEDTGKLLLSKGKLKKRVTIIPLNKISAARKVSDRQVGAAQREVGEENVNVALELVGHDEDVQKAMDYVFGGTLVCADSDSARAVAFHKDVRVRAVTLEGDLFDPAGTLTGGSRPQGGSVLARLRELSDARDALAACEHRLADLSARLVRARDAAARTAELRTDVELRETELSLLDERLSSDATARLAARHSDLTGELASLDAAAAAAEATMRDKDAEISGIEARMAEVGKDRETRVKAAEAAIAEAKRRLETTEAAHRERASLLETRRLEIEELEREAAAAEAQVESLEGSVRDGAARGEALNADVDTARDLHDAASSEVTLRRADIAKADRRLAQLSRDRDAAAKRVTDAELEIKRAEHALAAHGKEVSAAKTTVARMEAAHPWIASERHLFGGEGTDYDFDANPPARARRRLAALEKEQERLGKSINRKVMGMFEQAEQEYRDLKGKRDIIEADKAKIRAVIDELDGKKNEALTRAWEKVNKDFGSIYATLLPGATAKLVPPEGKTILDGLEIKVAFGGKWKSGLSELSGGQKSLCALSLVLALLLFNPAPCVVLDEVDSALDLSHTQNIGRMLKHHFAYTQFIIVSLKEGMFDNANVLFKTKFVDGASTVSRTVTKDGAINEARQREIDQENTANRAASKRGARGGKSKALSSAN